MIGPVDLERQRAALEPGLSAAVARVLEHGGFINGPEVREFEDALAKRVGVAHVIGCGSGTDALELLLRAAGIGPGDAVFVPSLSFVATAEAVVLTGAAPVFIDVEAGRGTLCPVSLKAAIAAQRAEGRLRPRAVISVDLFGIPADATAITEICRAEGLSSFFDTAHSIGTATPEGECGSFGDGAAASFYPSKALGCYGDGGAVLTNNDSIAEQIRAIGNHGVLPGRPGHSRVGTTSRLDTVQAAVLLEKLKLFDAELESRRATAARFLAALEGMCELPVVPQGCAPCWSYFAVTHPDRDRLHAHLESAGIRAVVYYATPIHAQPAFAGAATAPEGLVNTLAFSRGLLCLPLHPYLSGEEVEHVVAAMRAFPAALAAQ